MKEITCVKRGGGTTVGELPQYPSPCCILIKLIQKHPAVDFLILENLAGVSSKKLFFVQVSAVKYQDRESDKKCDAVRANFKMLGDSSPLKVYSQKANIGMTDCYFVYATTAPFPRNEKFKDAQFVYFVNLDPSFLSP